MRRTMKLAVVAVVLVLAIGVVFAAQSSPMAKKPATPQMTCPMCGQKCPMGKPMQGGAMQPGAMSNMPGRMSGMGGTMGGMHQMMGNMPGMAPAPVMSMDEHSLYLLRGNELYKINKANLQVEEQATLPAPRPPQAMNPPGGGMPPMGAPGPGGPPGE